MSFTTIHLLSFHRKMEFLDPHGCHKILLRTWSIIQLQISSFLFKLGIIREHRLNSSYNKSQPSLKLPQIGFFFVKSWENCPPETLLSILSQFK